MEILADLPRRWDEWMKLADPRVAAWPMMDSPIPTIGLVVSYIILIPSLKSFMKDRPPVGAWLKPILIVYNLFLVLLSAWMSIAIFYHSVIGLKFNFYCNNVVPYIDSEHHIGLAWALYIFWVSKFIEFFDTIFMALKKRNDQISFLHLYHHVSMPLLWWFGIKFAAGGDSYFSAMLNSFVHVIMYTYYFLAACGYSDIWWKHYLTQFQMVQFFFNMAFTLYTDIMDVCGPEYTFFLWMRRSMVFYMFSLLVLFGNFYIRAYLEKKRTPTTKKTQ